MCIVLFCSSQCWGGGGLFIQNFTTHADNSAVDSVAIVVPSFCTMGGVVSSTHTVTMTGGELASEIGQTTMKVYCNDVSGYVIYAIGSSDNVDGQTDLVSSLGSTYNIHTGTATSGATSAWAMKLTAGTVTNATDGINATPPTIASDTNGSFASYHAVPSTYTKVAYRESQTDMNSDVTATGSYLTTTYQVYANGAQPAGTYTGQVKYAVLHPYTNEQIKTLKMAFDQASGTETIVKDGTAYYTMQSMTSAICNATNIVGEVSQMQLIDERDNKLYWVTKLEDGHCWMTQNLDLNLETEATNVATLNSENTDLNQYGSSGYDSSNGYGCSNSVVADCEGGIITWTPERSTIPNGSLSSTTWKNDNSNPYSYTIGDTVVDGSNAYDGHKYAGTYYNWTATIASNNSASFTGNTFADVSQNPKNSVCPKGWRLPTISQDSGLGANSTNEFRRLNVLYNNNVTNNATNLMNAPLYFVRSGYVLRGSVGNSGGTASYWSSTVSGGVDAYFLGFVAGNVIPEDNTSSVNGLSKFGGLSVRCVAR